MELFCKYCKLPCTDTICPGCGNATKQYKYVIRVTPLKRHKTPGEVLIQKEEIENIRDGPVIGSSAVFKFHGRGYIPSETLIIFYPSGINSLNYPILSGFMELGYDVCVMFYDSAKQEYF